MHKASKLKRTLFWIEAAVSLISIGIVIGTLAIMFTNSVFSGGLGYFLEQVLKTLEYFSRPLQEMISVRSPFILVLVALIAAYIFTMMYFAQTVVEKKICRYVIPTTIVCFPLCVFGGMVVLLGPFVLSP